MLACPRFLTSLTRVNKFLGKMLFPKAPPYLQDKYVRELQVAVIVGVVLAVGIASGLYFNYKHQR